jgi:hypothetical protein
VTIRLSKSKFVAGCQCLKRLYFQIHQPELAVEPDDATGRASRRITMPSSTNLRSNGMMRPWPKPDATLPARKVPNRE